MLFSLTKASDVPLHEQLAEQIVFSIATGKLRQGAHLPSVRSLARSLGVHHNTVSKAYQDLVRRRWLQRQRGARLLVAQNPELKTADGGLDQIINRAIDNAREAGYSLQALQERVLGRLFEQRPDHVLIIELEPELGAILQAEIFSSLRKPVSFCSPDELASTPDLNFGAQVVAPEYLVRKLQGLMPQNRPCIPLMFSSADHHLAAVRGLPEPSTIGVASVSKTFLKTARGLLAPALGRRHTFLEFLIAPKQTRDLRGIDILFCDTATIPILHSKNKIPYRLIAENCLKDLAAAFEPLSAAP
jgi:GntR family transcriptional regulator